MTNTEFTNKQKFVISKIEKHLKDHAQTPEQGFLSATSLDLDADSLFLICKRFYELGFDNRSGNTEYIYGKIESGDYEEVVNYIKSKNITFYFSSNCLNSSELSDYHYRLLPVSFENWMKLLDTSRIIDNSESVKNSWLDKQLQSI